MAKRITYLFVAVALIAGSGVAVYWALRSGSSQPSPASDGQSAAGTGPARVLLNEILCDYIA